MVDSAGEWDWRILQGRLPQHILLRLAAVHRPQQSFPIDRVGWGLRDDRRFSIKSAYQVRWGQKDRLDTVDPTWKIIHRFRGMALAWELGYRQLVIETDSADALRLIEQKSKGGGPFTLVHRIHVLRVLDWRLVFSKIGRDSNDVADRLAKLASYDSLDTEFFDQSPL
ncbi:hypothetical protein V6N11_063794 [Hibiscus sabdariffa]|uniref:RNase H type-1 domain-containing protein n=1 Tax=Hibiscus sabdariffa TaxID=183260 RepID=A0ABR2PLQ7_9ROSI